MPKITLFAQPADFEPVLKVEPDIFPRYTAQEEGKGLHLNDVGKAAWLTALKLYPRVSLRLESYEAPGYEWTVVLSSPSVRLTLKCVMLKKKGVLPLRNPRSFVVAMELLAGSLAAVQFVQLMVTHLGRNPYEIAEAEQFTETFGVSAADAVSEWRELLEVDIPAQLRALHGEVKKELSEAESRDLGAAAEQARGLMVQAEGAIEEGNYDLTVSVLETARGILNDARELRKEEEHQRETAADMISFVQTAIIKAAKGGLETSRARRILSGAEQALSEHQDGEGAIKLAMQARSLVERESHRRDQARAALDTSRSMIEDARETGLDDSRIAQLQEKAERALSGHNYGMVQQYAASIRKSVAKLKKEHQLQLDKKEAAEYALDACQKVMREALRFDCDMGGCSELVGKAREAIKRGDFDLALELAESSRGRAEEAMRSCAEAMDAVQLATTTLKDAQAFIDTGKMEPYLDRAWEALKKNDYPEAINASVLCRDMIEVAEVEEGPRIEVEIRTRNLKPGIWNRALLDIRNAGVAHARNISVKFSGLLEASRLRKILFLMGGEGYTLEVGLKPAGAGELAYDVETSCARAFDGVGYSSRAHRWLTVAVDSAPEAPSAEGREEEEEAPKAVSAAEEKAESAVEEVYVVYHDGRLIFHEARRDRREVDEMSLSSLLTAVQNFIKDSFKYEKGGLGKLEFGSLTMVLEHGRLIYIAVVLSGRVPPGLRRQMRELIKNLEEKRFDSSGVWDGNMTALEDTHDEIRSLFGAAKPPDGGP